MISENKVVIEKISLSSNSCRNWISD